MSLESRNNSVGNSSEEKGTAILGEISRMEAEIKKLEAQLTGLKSKQLMHDSPEYWPNMGKINDVGGEISDLKHRIDGKRDELRLEIEQDPIKKLRIKRIFELKKNISKVSFPGERLMAGDIIRIENWQKEIDLIEKDLNVDDTSEAETKDSAELRNQLFENLYGEIRGMKEITNSSGRIYTPVEMIELIERVRTGELKINVITNKTGRLRDRVQELLSVV